MSLIFKSDFRCWQSPFTGANMGFAVAITFFASLILQSGAFNSSNPARFITRPLIKDKEVLNKSELEELKPFLTPTNEKKGVVQGQVGINKHIVGGSQASRGQFPWQAAIVMDDDWFCGGSLITPAHILTAAHCVEGARKFAVTLGSQNRDAKEAGRIAMDSYRAIAHPKWESELVRNDLAVIYLPYSVPTTPYIRQIRLPRRSYQKYSYLGASTVISGWGRTSDQNANVSLTLNNLQMEVISLMNCMQLYGRASVTPNNLCVHGGGRRGTCNGDSGGPLVHREYDGGWTQIGIVSYGAATGCGVGYPDVFTRVSAYLNWISARTSAYIRY